MPHPADAAHQGISRDEFRACLIAPLVIVGATVFVAWYTGHVADGHKGWFTKLTPPSVEVTLDTTLSAIPGTPAAKHRLFEQMRTIDSGIALQGEVTAYFYSVWFTAVTIAVGAGVLATALLFVLSGTWLPKWISLLRVSFVSTAAVAALFGTLLASYRYSQNAAENGASLQALMGLRHRVHTYCVTGQDLDGKQLPLTEMLHVIDRELQKVPHISIGFDEGKIRYTDLLKN